MLYPNLKSKQYESLLKLSSNFKEETFFLSYLHFFQRNERLLQQQQLASDAVGVVLKVGINIVKQVGYSEFSNKSIFCT